MKKIVFHILLGVVLLFGGVLLVPEKSEAQVINYKSKIFTGSYGCMYHLCTNNAGNDCSSPGSAIKICSEQ